MLLSLEVDSHRWRRKFFDNFGLLGELVILLFEIFVDLINNFFTLDTAGKLFFLFFAVWLFGRDLEGRRRDMQRCAKLLFLVLCLHSDRLNWFRQLFFSYGKVVLSNLLFK